MQCLVVIETFYAEQSVASTSQVLTFDDRLKQSDIEQSLRGQAPPHQEITVCWL